MVLTNQLSFDGPDVVLCKIIYDLQLFICYDNILKRESFPQKKKKKKRENLSSNNIIRCLCEFGNVKINHKHRDTNYKKKKKKKFST